MYDVLYLSVCVRRTCQRFCRDKLLNVAWLLANKMSELCLLTINSRSLNKCHN